MRDKAAIISRLEDPGVIAVVRARSPEQVLPLSEALVRGGVLAIEITMTTPRALDAIRSVSSQLGGKALVGVGTILDAQTCRAAIVAGAEFVVSPIVRPDVAAVANSENKPVMLGAYTPTEAQFAHESGADYVKLFPAEGLGPAYIKSLRAPLPHLRIIPTGGVDLDTIAGFFQAGCPAVGVGSSLISQKALAENDWPALERLAFQFSAAARRAKSGGNA